MNGALSGMGMRWIQRILCYPLGNMDASLAETLQRLKKEWDAALPLSSNNDERLWKKFRLEWDFHSNHIEGNTLTYGETELLVIFGETRGNHTLREYEEMKAHDVAIGHVRALAAEDRPLTEADVRGLNKLLLKEPFWKPAVTPEGASTRKQIIPGQYKTEPNKVPTLTGETFRFVDPLDVPQRMHDYLRILNAEFPSGADLFLHLARIHHEFLLIHPFDDGNGRVGRLLLNYALLKHGYPPVIVRTEQKVAYLSALHRADTEQRDYSELAAFLGKSLQWSLELGIKAAKGESIEEPSDIEKEIALFAQSNASEGPLQRSTDLILEVLEKSIKPLFRRIDTKATILKKLFSVVLLHQESSLNSQWESAVNALLPYLSHGGRIPLFLLCEHYNGKDAPAFGLNLPFSVVFDKYEYQINLPSLPAISRTYSTQLTESEIDEIVSNLLKVVFEMIKKKVEKK